MAVTPRFCWNNLAQGSGVTMTISSETVGNPKEYLLDMLRARSWRAATGWTIVQGFNDHIDITEGVSGDASATLTPGLYATGADMATQVATQINVVATDNTWTCTYDSGTKKFTIGHDNVQTGGLEWATGGNAGQTCGEDLGFDISTDDTGSASYVANDVSYQSRQFVKFDLGAADTVQFAAINDHNLGANGTVKIQGHTVDTDAGWITPDVDEAVTSEHSEVSTFIRLIFITSASKRYWRFLFNNTQSSQGFTTISLAHFGPTLEADRDFAMQYTKLREELTSIAESYEGIVWATKKRSRPAWQLTWPALSDATRALMETMLDTITKGVKFYFAFDPQNDETLIEYGYLRDDTSFDVVPPDKWTTSLTIIRELLS